MAAHRQTERQTNRPHRITSALAEVILSDITCLSIFPVIVSFPGVFVFVEFTFVDLLTKITLFHIFSTALCSFVQKNPLFFTPHTNE